MKRNEKSLSKGKSMIESIKKNKAIEAFAMIVDINGFTSMVNLAENSGVPTAQFIRDILSVTVEVVEEEKGIVVSFMGDAFLVIMETAEHVMDACIGIAVKIDKLNDYFNADREGWPITKKGLKIKIGIEYGRIDISDVHSSFLSTQKLFIGSTINYASRITAGGKKGHNKCLFGPKAFAAGLSDWSHEGPFKVKGKKGETDYESKPLNPISF